MTKVIIETERLQLFEYTTNDAAFIFELFNSPKWIKFIGDRNIKTLNDAKNFIETGYIKGYQVNGFGLYKVCLKDGTPIGTSGIVNRPNLEGYDLGYALLPQFEGKGFITEANEAVLKFAKEAYKIQELKAILLEENSESIAVLERLGFKSQVKSVLKGETEEMLMYLKKLDD